MNEAFEHLPWTTGRVRRALPRETQEWGESENFLERADNTLDEFFSGHSKVTM